MFMPKRSIATVSDKTRQAGDAFTVAEVPKGYQKELQMQCKQS